MAATGVRSLVIGASGLVGSHVARALEKLGPVQRTAFTRATSEAPALDIRDEATTTVLVRRASPDVVVCAAAEAFVERCELEPETTGAINVDGTANLARAAAAAGALFVFFSSDYVFDGTRAPYEEDDPPDPVNEYGHQKVRAESIVRSLEAHLVCRVSGVFGVEPARKNFVYKVVDRLSGGQTVRVANDQILCPTAAADLAVGVVALVQRGARGVVHAAGPDALTRVDFARRIARAFELDERRIEGVPTSTLGLVARRPPNTALRTDRLCALIGSHLPPTDTALTRLRATGLDSYI